MTLGSTSRPATSQLPCPSRKPNARVATYSVDGNALVTTLEIGDNFVMNVKIGNLEGVDFWVICCTKPMHIIRKEFTDKWDTSFAIGVDVATSLHNKQ